MATKLIEDNDIFAKLPEDVILYLAPYIDYMDMFCLSEVSNHLKDIFLRMKYRIISLSCDFRVTCANFKQVLVKRLSFDFVKQLDLSGIYWLPKEDLFRVIFYFKFVEKVNLFGTKVMTISFIISRQLEDTKVLSLTYSMKGELCNVPMFAQYSRKTTSEKFIESTRPMLDFEYNMVEYKGINTDEEYLCYYDLKYEGSIPFTPIDAKNIKLGLYHCKGSRCDTFHLGLTTFQQKIGLFAKLEKLSIDIPIGLSSSILEYIFKGCKKLNFIKLKSGNPSFCLAYLEYAESLEHIYFQARNGDFNLEKFFLDVVANKTMKLRRISLNFQNCPKIDRCILDNFLTENPQLLLLYIRCGIPSSAIRDVQNCFNKYSSVDKQKVYLMRKRTDTVTDLLNMNHIPLIHFDMFMYDFFF